MVNGRIAVIGSGSWATALAKVIVEHTHEIGWYVRRPITIDRFKLLRHNPGYLRNLAFDVAEIDFSSDINYIVSHYDTLLFVTPSPYTKELLDKVRVPMRDKFVITAIKGSCRARTRSSRSMSTAALACPRASWPASEALPMPRRWPSSASPT